MTTSLLMTDFHVKIAQILLQKIAAGNQWFFVGDYTQHDNTDVADMVEDTTSYNQAWKNMIMGKAIAANDAILAITNYPYEAGTIFSMYDDQDPTLFDEQFYCVVNVGSYSHVFKCLDNNYGSNSTVSPDFTQIVGANCFSYETADGYKWKYMYSVDSLTVSKYATADYFPLVANNVVANNAVPGSINIIQVTNSGKLYNNYTFGSFTSGDIKINGDTLTYNLSNNMVYTTNSYYTGCLIYLTSGTGIGQYKTITDYISNANGNFIKIDSSFLVAPQNGTTFEIYPICQVVGDGNQTINCIARAIVNSYNSNSISSIEVLNGGQNYISANATVVANSVVGVTSMSTVRPIMSPSGGHGSNSPNELNARSVIVGAILSNSEANTILTTNFYQQIGIIQNPIFNIANVSITTPSTSFTQTEEIFVVSPVTTCVNCSSTAGNNVILGNNGTSFATQFSNGSYVLLNGNTTVNQIAVINTVTNSSFLTLTSNVLYTTNNTLLLQHPNISANMYCTSIITSNNIMVSNIAGVFATGSTLIGSQTGAVCNVSSVSRSNVPKFFNTFIQLYKYNVTVGSGVFTQGEVITQQSTKASGLLHSVQSNNTLYVSNMSSLFALGGGSNNIIIGTDSGAIATLNGYYQPELLVGQGNILYLENIEQITRQNNQNEQFQLVFNF